LLPSRLPGRIGGEGLPVKKIFSDYLKEEIKCWTTMGRTMSSTQDGAKGPSTVSIIPSAEFPLKYEWQCYKFTWSLPPLSLLQVYCDSDSLLFTFLADLFSR